MIYFVRCQNGPVKIGYANDPESRLSNLQVGCPYPLELLACIEASREDEACIHVALRNIKVRGEWYEFSETVIELIDQLQKGASVQGILLEQQNCLEPASNDPHGNLVQRLKERQGDMTQDEFAAHLGISAGFLSHLYSGARQIGLSTILLINERYPDLAYLFLAESMPAESPQARGDA